MLLMAMCEDGSLERAPREADADPLIVENLRVVHGETIAVDDVSFSVKSGEIVALLGANGAGKSSLLQAISGLVPIAAGAVSCGGVTLNEMSPQARANYVAHVPEGRMLFSDHTALENLTVPMLGKSRSHRRERVGYVEGVLPRLPALAQRRAGLLSGGEQQMVALGRGLVSGSPVLVIDELSLGLAPIVAEEFGGTLQALRSEGFAILLVEQQLSLALAVADRVVVLDRGHIILEGRVSEVRAQVEAIENAYLGGDADGLPGVGFDKSSDGGATGTIDTKPNVAPLIASSIGATGLLAFSFFAWFKVSTFSAAGVPQVEKLNAWNIGPAWGIIPLLAAVLVVGIALRNYRSLGSGIGWPLRLTALASGLTCVGLILARTWLLNVGLPGGNTATYARSFGLFFALNFAALVAYAAVAMVNEGFGAARPDCGETVP